MSCSQVPIFATVLLIFSLNYCSGNPQLLDPQNGNCEKLIEDYADKSATYMYCAILNARPFTFCESCIGGYIDVLSAYLEIYEMHDNETGESCKDKLLNQDRVEILEETFKSLAKLWGRSECDSCFEFSANGTLTNNLRNSTLEFNRLQLLVKECIDEHLNDTVSVCDTCQKPYHNLNLYYNNIKMQAEDSENGNVCMDILDLMNGTRSLWSHELLCLPQRRPQIPLVVISSLIMSLPLWLYGLSFCFKKLSTREHATD
ncbi:osteopetrosis-associated transmembrane protein 1 [Neocloeon triangulifer]|uniref:osteopetrosis-associated transmembrane protein 1 n=1 Tax=Neocloeon triangulifer TaxID=2078957 RepID=UPI00286EF95D|nr:osteopetrosis-associated transmembrane protein 1 [Neocloeon triangulifer]